MFVHSIKEVPVPRTFAISLRAVSALWADLIALSAWSALRHGVCQSRLHNGP